MFLLKRPSQEAIEHFLTQQQASKLSYPEVGASRTGAPSGYLVDHNRIKLGEGMEIFQRACAAINCWQMFKFGWVELLWPNTPIKVGENVGILVNHFGFWSLNASRIVYLMDEASPITPIIKYGFAYGTLLEHGECGEERFTVEFHKNDNSVWYDLYAFSHPNHFLAKLGYPLCRLLQKRFAHDSKQAMLSVGKI